MTGKISVVGGGAWGTALGAVLASNGTDVLLYAREKDVVDSINEMNVNKSFLPAVKLPKTLTATSHLNDISDSSIVLVTTPAQFFREQIRDIAEMEISDETIFVICSKGIENESLNLMSTIFQDVLDNPHKILSGPTFAEEVANGISTAVSLACRDMGLGEAVKERLERASLRIHLNNDIVGSQVCGAIKNVIAIGCGIISGLGQGENSRAAILTQGFHEIMKVNLALGGRAETLTEPCGIGDLVLTCSSSKSRNFSFGVELAQNKSGTDILAGRLSVVEGVATSASVTQLAAKLKVELPLCTKINEIIEGKAAPEDILALV